MARDFDQSALVMFARELQAARATAGMTRELLATKINYSPSLIGMVETCRRVPGWTSPGAAMACSAFLTHGCPAAEVILGGVDHREAAGGFVGVPGQQVVVTWPPSMVTVAAGVTSSFHIV